MKNLEKLMRPHLLKVKAYSSARDEYDGATGVFLDANENSLGSATEADYNRYPDPHQRLLKEKWSQLKGIRPDQVFFGNGSDEPIDLLIRLFCDPETDHIITMPPTYGMYQVSADINAVEVKSIPLLKSFQMDVDQVLGQADAYSKLLFICSPNNPTGNLIDRTDIETILDQFPGVVVIDEAYIDFSKKPGWLSELDRYPNLVVLQTLSKAWGMAGIRVGAAMGHPSVISMLDKIKPPYNISQANQQIALSALDSVEKKAAYVEELLSQRDWLQAQLTQLPNVKEVLPGEANFLLVRFSESAEIFQYLTDRQVIVRDRSNQLNCEGALRITVGTAAENAELISLLKKFTSNNP